MIRWFFKGFSACVRERRPPYVYYVFKQYLKRSFRHVFPFQWDYFLSYAVFRLRAPHPVSADAPDLVFVLKRESAGWILEGICKEIANYFPGRTAFHHLSVSKRLPDARAYFFSHYSLFPKCLKRNPKLWGRPTLVFYTHAKETRDQDIKELIYAFGQCTKVVCQSSASAKKLVLQGVPAEKTAYVLGGADPDLFAARERSGKGLVGFCTAYYPRKAPDRILEIIQSMPQRNFILLAPKSSEVGSRHRKWDRYERFTELLAQPNFLYVEADYAEYPEYYARMDVFVSASYLEGGPIPLIEAMMSNIVPVASDTGFTADVIRHGENGFIFPVDTSVSQICEWIERAFILKTNVRFTAESLSWKHYSLEILKLLGYNPNYDSHTAGPREPHTDSRLVVPI